MPIHKDIQAYNAAQPDPATCEALAKAIDRHLKGAECKIWHRHPVWFLAGNPIVGYRDMFGPHVAAGLLDTSMLAGSRNVPVYLRGSRHVPPRWELLADRVPVVDLDFDIWSHVINVNLHGTFLMSRAFARQMVPAGRGGSIINISSIAGRMAPAATAAYGASKAAIHALTCSMAKELGPDQIRVNAICPGLIETSRMDDMRANNTFDRAVGLIPLRRAGTGEDIASKVVFLCSDQGSWTTGDIITVDGGHMAIP